MRRLLSTISVALFLASCSGNDRATDNLIPLVPKYTLRECLVRIDFNWDAQRSLLERGEVVSQIVVSMGEATVKTRKLPLFFGHATRDPSYFLFYYTDRCEERVSLTKQFVEEFVRPKSSNFPNYSIVSEGIEPGFDGVFPSGAWLADDTVKKNP